MGFYSRKFQPAELNYPIHDKELSAIIAALEHWRTEILSLQSQLKIYTDHHSLEYFMTTKVLTRRQARWAERLADYDFLIFYRSGKQSTKPDALTRRDDVYPSPGESFAANNPQNIQPLLRQSHLMAISTSEIASISSLELLAKIKDAQEQDDKISAILSDLRKGDYPGSEHYTLANDLVMFDHRILVPDLPELQTSIVRSRHDHPSAGHPGRTKTLQLIRRDFYWPRMTHYVDRYVANCFGCSRYKRPRRKPHGLLQPLPISDKPWKSISMDFIEQLPNSGGFDAILVVVDRFSKMAIFLPCTTTTTSEDLALLFIQHIFSKFGVPQDVISDRGSKFTSAFWTSIAKSLGLKSKLSTAYHPQTDGQTERVNQILEAYLRQYLSYQQDDWHALLPLAEFACNNSEHSSTQQSPFSVVLGFNPALDIDSSDLPSQRASDFVQVRRKAQEDARKSLDIAVTRYKHFADQHRIPAPQFQLGQRVWLDCRNIRTTRPSDKLSEKQLGPFTISKVISDTAYKLDLPDHLASIHPVFHVSLLTPASDQPVPGQVQEPPPAVQVEGQELWTVAEVQDSRIRHRRLEYLVLWDGFDQEGDRSTWEPMENLAEAPDVVADFHFRYPNKPKPQDLQKSTSRRTRR